MARFQKAKTLSIYPAASVSEIKEELSVRTSGRNRKNKLILEDLKKKNLIG